MLTEKQIENYWKKVDKTSECWIWTSVKDRYGYGRFPANRKFHGAHRVSYQISFGAIPSGKVIDHVCHRRDCVNPAHLRTATLKQNQENRHGPQRNNTSGVLGVSWSNYYNKWAASVGHNSKRIYCGRYDDLADAEDAVVKKRLELFTHNDLDRIAI